ncbi:phosphatase PAP2 family protein [Streptomyces sp. BE20]|uniref:bifunctional phosphatase PAP2/diacylglycerol kinase family protein n=1 Tax=Streptomyces sp. BE20 TaxID=3002525 RepID=UPI002E77850E|nr:phosphatase PAP2 family protein [Streptomyces sp. BE20]MEE1824961.1 phosphatase PAP2 family protein [Streptomyces sp. BE20]
MRRLDVLDQALFTRIATARSRGTGRRTAPWMRGLSRAANHGVLWFGTAAVLGAVGGRAGRRAALRGVGSLALASTVANIAAKQLTRRPRPQLDPVPAARRLLRQPITTSFPSGHSASAAAFATAVAIESPAAAAVVVPAALAVGASRVYTGAHYPGDVLAGFALGSALAALTLRWWPRSSDVPPPAGPPRRAAPALPEGAGLSVVVNSGSGSGALTPAGPEETAELLRTLLTRADVRVCGPDDDLPTLLTEAADRAAAAGGALGVCGGDGSVNLAAGLAVERNLPLAVFPGGTLNHFALDLGIDGPEATAAAVAAGTACGVDLGIAADDTERRHFLNTFSLGVYPELVRVRESLEGRLGKWPALAVAVVRVLAAAEPVTVRAGGRDRRLWLLFAGNGAYDPPGFAPTHRTGLADGLLDIRIVDGGSPFGRTRLAAAFLSGTLSRSRVYHSARLGALDLDALGSADRIAVDGESVPAAGALRLAKARQALTVYRPALD